MSTLYTKNRGNASSLFIKFLFYTINKKGVFILIKINIVELLKKEKKTKYWLCTRMSMTNRNLNRIIEGKTTSISFKYIEDFCRLLNCTPGDLIAFVPDENSQKED